MNLGLAIFLSSMILGLIFLFHSTKDRWNWKKIIKVTSYVLISLVIISSIYYFFFLHSNSVIYKGPSKATSFWDIKLGNSKEDVVFLRGYPDETDSLKSIWFYIKKYYGRNNEYYKIVFNDNKVTSVVYYGKYWSPNLLGRNFVNYPLQSLKDYLGEPSYVSSSPDGLKRVYSFNSFNVVFYMQENKVFGYGIYNPSYGTYKY